MLFVIIPLVILWLSFARVFKNYLPVFALCIIGSIIFSFPWDYLVIKERIWYFTAPFIIGVALFGVPIENLLFYIFVTILFTCITILLWEKYGVEL